MPSSPGSPTGVGPRVLGGHGTDRLAPYARRRAREGIELSQDMVDRMREKPGGEEVEVTLGDMSQVGTGRSYGLVYLVFNTIGNLLTQDDQVRCFENAARHLTDDGVFVLECLVPTAPSRPGHQFVDAARVGVDHPMLDVCRYDPLSQVLDVNHVQIGSEGIIFAPDPTAHGPPAGVRPHGTHRRPSASQQVGGWNEEPFDSTSWRHISVYERARA